MFKKYSPLAAFESLGDIKNKSLLGSMESNFRMSQDITREKQREARERREREKKLGIGRMLGTAVGIGANFLLPGAGTALMAGIQGGLIGGAGSAAGQYISGGTKRVPVGKWNVAADRETNRLASDRVTSSIISDAVTSGLLSATMFKAPKTIYGEDELIKQAGPPNYSAKTSPPAKIGPSMAPYWEYFRAN